MRSTWTCPNGHLNSFKCTEYSPDVNYVLFDEQPCEECGVEFDEPTWKFEEVTYDDDDLSLSDF